jgi:glutamate 5-kinase
VIAPGGEPDVILRLAASEPLGTLFHPTTSALESRKRYILAGGRASGALRVDAGAARALHNGGSLLPVGVVQVSGAFERGDPVHVLDPGVREIARGLANYASTDLERIRGEKSEMIAQVLGFDYGEEVIHRNHMVLL